MAAKSNIENYPNFEVIASIDIATWKLAKIDENPLHHIATLSAALGIAFGLCVASLPYISNTRVLIYILCLSAFHFFEYYITAKYNSDKVTYKSFLLTNGKIYSAFHLMSISESLIEACFFPNIKLQYFKISYVGAFILLVGQFFRSTAMITAGRSFSHAISLSQKKEHTLVTKGIYSLSRHPSYAGFFWWVVGSQFILLNPLSLIIGISTTYWFFKTRIPFEEQYLIKFFGEDYEQFRVTTGTLIPFIK